MVDKNAREILADQSVIFREGQPATNAYLLVNGKVSLLKNNGKELVSIHSCEPGEFIGVNALIDGKDYSVTARVIGGATVIPIPKDTLKLQLQKLDKLTLNIIYSTINRYNALLHEKLS